MKGDSHLVTLNDKLSVLSEMKMLLPLPEYLSNNLNEKFEIRHYQTEAFRRFITYFNGELRRHPGQVLFHMATGSGKTLIMAGLIIYLYKQGYRNFVFFVNSSNIIEKTKNNFLDVDSIKYLFAEQIIIDGQLIQIKELNNFQYSDDHAINIKFSTIQGLHNDLNFPKENSITFEDFENKKIVLISDEAHHINVSTKQSAKLSANQIENAISWETTVSRIYTANRENLLLEFTATCDLENPNIKDKYNDKIIFDYPLSRFREDKYSKEVKVLQIDVSTIRRALQAVLISQYRLKIFQKYGKQIKPVILFKSKTINDSRIFYSEFITKIKELSILDIQQLLSIEEPLIGKILNFYKSEGINLNNLAEEIKGDFGEERCIVVNSNDESEENQITVNTLEAEDNHVRAVFAVDKLNEGWDVLNLFDIVRLYDTRDAKAGKPGKTTIAEAQLIGRGARYCPFQLDEFQSKFQRKYDGDVENELRICEELYYHSKYNPRYIQELTIALKETGLLPPNTTQISLRLKEEFKNTEFYKKGLVFVNERVKKTRNNVNALPESSRTKIYNVNLPTGYAEIDTIFEQEQEINMPILKNRKLNMVDIGITIIGKAMRGFPVFEYRNMKKFLPNVRSSSFFIKDENYLGNIQVIIRGKEEDVDNLSMDHSLYVCREVLREIEQTITSINIEYEGTTKFKPLSIKETFRDKVINLTEIKEEGVGTAQSTLSGNLKLNLLSKEWFAYEDNYGTSEEKRLTVFIDAVMDNLYQKYEKVYLIRNERFIQLFTFEDGQQFEPDFVLFLQQISADHIVQYQVFIEPKGTHLLDKDIWKENFLSKIRHMGSTEEILWENHEYIIWGLPFYNHEKRNEIFIKEFELLLEE
jgi:type III restriction enzyme